MAQFDAHQRSGGRGSTQAEEAGGDHCSSLGFPTGVLFSALIGVRTDHRRHGIGRLLVEAVGKWMDANNVADVWVLADNSVAEEFYRRCGFSTGDSMSL